MNNNNKKKDIIPQMIALLSIVGTLMIHSFLIIWWASSLSTRVNVLEAWVRDNREMPTMLYRMEERFDHLKGSVERVLRKIEKEGGPHA